MNVVKRSTLVSYANENRFATATGELTNWFKTAKKAQWKDLLDVQVNYPKAEAVLVGIENYTVFNICGNKFRLVVLIVYKYGRILIKDFLTHPEYSSGNWKKTLIKAQVARKKVQKLSLKKGPR